jgi:hemerythrin
MEKYTWIEKYSVGVKTLDEQHQHYFETVEGIIKMTGQEDISTGDLMSKIIDLNDYAIHHFATEENLFEKYSYSETEDHASEHRNYEEKMDEFINEAKKDGADVKKTALEVAEFAGSWLINHVMNVDQKYVGFMRENGVK